MLNKVQMKTRKRIALVAHDNKKRDMIDWVKYNKPLLKQHELFATGTTGSLIKELGLDVTCLKSGPLGGDTEIGAMISNNLLDILIFYFDPMDVMPHDVDIKALLRLGAVYNVVIACNRATADFAISSHLIQAEYTRLVEDYADYRDRLKPTTMK